MNLIFWPCLDKAIAVYLDDIMIYSNNLKEHVRLLELIFDQLAEYQLFVIRSKCKFRVPTIEFLGHIISFKGVQPNPGQIESIRLLPVPTSVHDI